MERENFKLENFDGTIYLLKNFPYLRIALGHNKLSALYTIEAYREVGSLPYSVAFELINHLCALRADLYGENEEEEYENLLQFRLTEYEFLKDNVLSLPKLIYYSDMSGHYYVLYYIDSQGKENSSQQFFFKDDIVDFITERIAFAEIQENDGEDFLEEINFNLIIPENPTSLIAQLN